MKAMKLPSWLTGTKTSVLPDPSTHVDFTAEALLIWVENGGKVRLVAFPGLGADIRPVNGRWPLITRVRVAAHDPEYVAVSAEDIPDAAHYMRLNDIVTVAPADLPGE